MLAGTTGSYVSTAEHGSRCSHEQNDNKNTRVRADLPKPNNGNRTRGSGQNSSDLLVAHRHILSRAERCVHMHTLTTCHRTVPPSSNDHSPGFQHRSTHPMTVHQTVKPQRTRLPSEVTNAVSSSSISIIVSRQKTGPRSPQLNTVESNDPARKCNSPDRNAHRPIATDHKTHTDDRR